MPRFPPPLTVPTFNCCTKCLGTGRNTRPHARLSSSFLGMDALRTSIPKVPLICKLCWSLVYLVYFLTCYSWIVYDQTLSDAQSTGAGIKCLYCTTGQSRLSLNMAGKVTELQFPNHCIRAGEVCLFVLFFLCVFCFFYNSPGKVLDQVSIPDANATLYQYQTHQPGSSILTPDYFDL